MHAHRGFTIVELLVVIAIIGVFSRILFRRCRRLRGKPPCRGVSNMRQVGLAIRQYCDVNHGRWPLTSHTSDTDAAGLYTKAWIYTIAPFMEDVDAIRICPDDPHGDERLKIKMTSYALNGYLTIEAPPPLQYLNATKLKATSKTIVMFELADTKPLDLTSDDVHCFNWFVKSAITSGSVFNNIKGDVQTDRHGGSANYLTPTVMWSGLRKRKFRPGPRSPLISRFRQEAINRDLKFVCFIQSSTTKNLKETKYAIVFVHLRS